MKMLIGILMFSLLYLTYVAFIADFIELPTLGFKKTVFQRKNVLLFNGTSAFEHINSMVKIHTDKHLFWLHETRNITICLSTNNIRWLYFPETMAVNHMTFDEITDITA